MRLKDEAMTASEFYGLRDQRTALEITEDARLTASLLIGISDEEAQTVAGQAAFLLLVNLSSRWCRTICIYGPDIQLFEPLASMHPGSNLLEAAILCARHCDPFGDFQISQSTSQITAHVHVGRDAPEGAYPICGRGWLALTGENARSGGCPVQPDNALGAILAGSIGAWHAFSLALGRQAGANVHVSLWNLDEDNEATQGPEVLGGTVGRVGLIGVGAIGGAIAYLLPVTRIDADLILVDRDVADFPNLNRVPLFYADDVFSKLLKVEIVHKFLTRCSISSQPVEAWFHEADSHLGALDLLIAGANEHNVQPAIMNRFPPIIIGASTGPDWDAFLQRHIPLKEDCLECRLPTKQTAAPTECATGVFDEPTAQTALAETGALPFLSVAAGVMAVSELQKLAACPDYPLNSNYAVLSFKSSQPTLLATQFSQKAGCSYCWKPEPAFHALHKQSRHYHLST